MGLEVARFSESNPKYVKGRRAQAGLLPSLDITLPRNDGVHQYIDIRLREGAVVGIPKWPSSTSLATMGITDYVSNMVLNVWEQIVPGRERRWQRDCVVRRADGNGFPSADLGSGNQNRFCRSGGLSHGSIRDGRTMIEESTTSVLICL